MLGQDDPVPLPNLTPIFSPRISAIPMNHAPRGYATDALAFGPSF